MAGCLKTLRTCASLFISSLCLFSYWTITFPVWSDISAFIGRIILNFKKCCLSEACKRCREKIMSSSPVHLLVSQRVEVRFVYEETLHAVSFSSTPCFEESKVRKFKTKYFFYNRQILQICCLDIYECIPLPI